MNAEKELKPFPFFGYAPGNYMNTCSVCKKDIYNVDKLCFVCLECAIVGGAYHNLELQKREHADLLEWFAMAFGALTELVELKKIKDEQGKTDDYLERQPKAWYLANQCVELWKKNDYKESPAPSQSQPPKGVEEAAKEHVDEFCKPVYYHSKEAHNAAYKSFIAGANWQSKQDGWVSVEERLPEDRERVLVFKYTRQIKEALFIKKDEWDRDNQFIIGGAYYDIQKWITHWMPLPAPPSTDNGKP